MSPKVFEDVGQLYRPRVNSGGDTEEVNLVIALFANLVIALLAWVVKFSKESESSESLGFSGPLFYSVSAEVKL